MKELSRAISVRPKFLSRSSSRSQTVIARNYLIWVSLASELQDISSQNTLKAGLGASRREGNPPGEQDCGHSPKVSKKQTTPTQQTTHD